jgi:hypothetical protein
LGDTTRFFIKKITYFGASGSLLHM